MAGIYIHVPYCKQACSYCDFYFTCSLNSEKDYLSALLREIEYRKDYLNGNTINSIYFGGGTPSMLYEECSIILNKLSKIFSFDKNVEITLEANPDDLKTDVLKYLFKIGINRLSIGVQSFQEIDLQFMRRSHTAEQAFSCIEEAVKVGFKSISIDLIYGTPTLTLNAWKKNLETLNKLGVNHLSCYSLTVEKHTKLFHDIKKGKTKPLNEKQSIEHFKELSAWALLNNWEQYEVSNFAKNKAYSKHNTSYWQGKTYLGLGPSAHSYNVESRQWNIANLQKYIKGLNNSTLLYNKEYLNTIDNYNEYIFTRLRTKWGVDKEYVKIFFPNQYQNFLKSLDTLDTNFYLLKGSIIKLTEEGLLMSDYIAECFFILNEKNDTKT